MNTPSIDMTHMCAPSHFISNWGNRKYVLEGRNPVTGHLDFSIKIPFMYATERQLTRHYFNCVKTGGSASRETICKWYNDHNIFFRPKTW